MNEEYLMTGSFGLDIDAWQGSFYDNDLPPDWRAASYSTLLRSVLLTEKEWHKAAEMNWIEEVDEDFRFVFYADPSDASEFSDLTQSLASLSEALSAQLAGLVVKIEPEALEAISIASLNELAGRFPLCLDAGTGPYAETGMDVFCDRARVAAVWYPAVQSDPVPCGDFLVTLINQESLPEQKHIISKIDQWMTGSRVAGLFNTNKKDAPVRAQETRILAELMGV